MLTGTAIVIAAAWWYVGRSRADQYNTGRIDKAIPTAWALTGLAVALDLIHLVIR